MSCKIFINNLFLLNSTMQEQEKTFGIVTCLFNILQSWLGHVLHLGGTKGPARATIHRGLSMYHVYGCISSSNLASENKRLQFYV